jgi:hypothetical protein
MRDEGSWLGVDAGGTRFWRWWIGAIFLVTLQGLWRGAYVGADVAGGAGGLWWGGMTGWALGAPWAALATYSSRSVRPEVTPWRTRADQKGT